jgi:hypothetical protein
MRKKVASNGTNGRLEEALANLINNQALFVGQLGRMDERFARIEKQLAAIENLLLHHQEILEGLPEAIRQKIGFKGQG